MRVNMVQGDPDLAFSSLVYQAPDERLLGYLQNNIQEAYQHVEHLGTQFMDNVSNMYEKFNSADVINRGKAILHSMQMHMDPMAIYPLGYEEIPQANYAMQRYIMVQPELRELYNDQMCNGYVDTYLDYDPGAESHQDHAVYQQVMDGVLVHDVDTDDGVINFYTNSVTVDEDDLHPMDRISIMDTWDRVAVMIAEGKDPSDPDDGEL